MLSAVGALLSASSIKVEMTLTAEDGVGQMKRRVPSSDYVRCKDPHLASCGADLHRQSIPARKYEAQVAGTSSANLPPSMVTGSAG